MVREIRENELRKILELYLHLHEKSIPEMTKQLECTWNTIIQDKNHHIIVKEVDGKIVSMHTLELRIREHLKKNPAVILRGDSDASVSALVSVMDCAKMCGAKEIYVSADKK